MTSPDLTGKLAIDREAFTRDVIAGLSASPKTLPSRWLYDTIGSALFEDITHLPEYYPTRTEIAILEACVDAVADRVGPGVALFEYGAGALRKTRLLLDALHAPRLYAPIDIAEEFLRQSAETLARELPGLEVRPIAADFTSAEISAPDLARDAPRLGFFPGSTLGNLDEAEVFEFLSSRRRGLGDRSHFLVGIDLAKDPDILVPAYEDAAGVTAAFNLNLLARMRSELGAELVLEAFAHEARWNSEASQMEMHLVSLADQSIRVGAANFTLARGETIRSEISRKFHLTDLDAMIAGTGWAVDAVWTDPQEWFAVVLLKAC